MRQLPYLCLRYSRWAYVGGGWVEIAYVRTRLKYLITAWNTFQDNKGKVSLFFSLEIREYGRRDPSRSPRGTLYLHKLALTLPTSGGRTIGRVCSRTKATEFFFIVGNSLTTRPWRHMGKWRYSPTIDAQQWVKISGLFHDPVNVVSSTNCIGAWAGFIAETFSLNFSSLITVDKCSYGVIWDK
jgi:hypothetical protein